MTTNEKGQISLAHHWLEPRQPLRLTQPRVNPDLLELHPIVRSAEVLRYSFAKIEYWLSPGGLLREVLRLSLLTTALMAVPVLLVIPLITTMLVQVSGWTGLLIKILIDISAIAAGVAIAIFIFRAFRKKPR